MFSWILVLIIVNNSMVVSPYQNKEDCISDGIILANTIRHNTRPIIFDGTSVQCIDQSTVTTTINTKEII